MPIRLEPEHAANPFTNPLTKGERVQSAGLSDWVGDVLLTYLASKVADVSSVQRLTSRHHLHLHHLEPAPLHAGLLPTFPSNPFLFTPTVLCRRPPPMKLPV